MRSVRFGGTGGSAKYLDREGGDTAEAVVDPAGSAGSSHLPPSENSPAAVWHPATHRPRSEEPTGLLPHITATHCSPGHKARP